MIEITKLIHKQRFISRIINLIFHLFILCIRIIYKSFNYKNDNIVVISLNKLGDTIFTIPAIREIQRLQKKNIIIVCYPETVPIYKIGLEGVQFCKIGRGEFYFHHRIANRNARKILSYLEPEIIYDFTGVMTSASLIFNSGAKKIVGTNREQFKAVYDLYIPTRNTPHLMDIYLDIVSLNISGIQRERAKIFQCNKTSVNKILIHAFAGWKAKEWGLEKFVRLSENLMHDYNVSFVIPFGFLSKDIIEEIKYKNINIVETHTIDEMIECIRDCSVFVGNDSGPIHIASLLGKPTFGIYGPTNPEFHIPFGNDNAFSRINIKCSPQKGEKLCFTDGGRVGCPSFECMRTLTVESVLNDLKEFIYKIDKKVLIND